jgi:hypothetical protein
MNAFIAIVLASLLSRLGYQMARSPVLPIFAADLGRLRPSTSESAPEGSLKNTPVMVEAATMTPMSSGKALDKVVAAVKADQAVALAMFIKGEGGFLDRDLYPFCFRIADARRASPVRRLFQLAQTLEPLRTPTATRMVRQSTRRRRSRKVCCFWSLAH